MEPEFERCRGLLKDRSRQRVDVVPAVIAGMGRAPGNAVMLPIHTAFLTLRHAARKPLFLQRLKAGVVTLRITVFRPPPRTGPAG